MADNKSKLTIEDYKSDFIFKKKENGLNIQFNRVAFIFFVFFIIYLIYTIHLIQLGSRKSKFENINNLPGSKNKLYRADIIDINGNYLAKTVKSIDIGLKTSDIISKEKLLLSLKIIFPDKNFKEILKQIRIYKPRIVVVNSIETFIKLKKIFKKKIKILNNYKESKKYLKKIDTTISAIPGINGLEPTIFFTAISKKVLIANKESVICGWNLITKIAKKFNTKLIPIDSEHFSINFLIKNYLPDQISKIYITASGGPFLNLDKKSFKKVQPNQAIKHPKWKMGKKISIDSATLMNKVLEIIEYDKVVINNIDITVLSQVINISKISEAIISNLSDLLRIDKQLINVKGKSFDNLGVIGDGIASACIALVSVKDA